MLRRIQNDDVPSTSLGAHQSLVSRDDDVLLSGKSGRECVLLGVSPFRFGREVGNFSGPGAQQKLWRCFSAFSCNFCIDLQRKRGTLGPPSGTPIEPFTTRPGMAWLNPSEPTTSSAPFRRRTERPATVVGRGALLHAVPNFVVVQTVLPFLHAPTDLKNTRGNHGRGDGEARCLAPKRGNSPSNL